MRKVKVAVAQINSVPLAFEHNWEEAECLLGDAAKQEADIVCLPELFACGYDFAKLEPELPRLCEPLDGPTVRHLCNWASKWQMEIVAGLPLRLPEQPGMYNGAVYITSNGTLGGYTCKNHLFRDERRAFSVLNHYPVFQTSFGSIGMLICYDNNFPETARILTLRGAELLLMPAAWRVQEKDIWDLMIAAHACENSVAFAACNFYQKSKDLLLFGHSKIVDCRGCVLKEADRNDSQLVCAEIDLDEQQRRRQQELPWLQDRRPESYGDLVKT